MLQGAIYARSGHWGGRGFSLGLRIGIIWEATIFGLSINRGSSRDVPTANLLSFFYTDSQKSDFFEVPLKKLNGEAMKLMDRILHDPKSS